MPRSKLARRPCEHCGAMFRPRRKGHRYHSPRCKWAAWDLLKVRVSRRREPATFGQAVTDDVLGLVVAPYYRCGCGHTFDVELGKYGCPNCCGDRVAKLVSA